MRRFAFDPHHLEIPGVKGIQITLHDLQKRLFSFVIGAAVCVASYLFIVALVQEDKLGHRTLSVAAWIVVVLRGVGRLFDIVGKGFTLPTIPIFITAALIVAARYLLIYLGRKHFQLRKQHLILAGTLALFMITWLFVLIGNLMVAALMGLLSGIALLFLDTGNELQTENENKYLFLIPLGLGIVLRFYALAQVSNGYAQHAAILHAQLSIPLLEALSTSLLGHNLQPFFGMVGDMLLHEQSGALPLVEAIGFQLFGVSITVSRLISAALGTLTIYVAYRLGQSLGSIRLGLIFSFLVAVSPWQVTISRYSTAEHVLSPLQLLLSLLFLVRAVKGGRIIDILLAAFFTSMGLLIYATNIVVPVIAALFLLLRALVDLRLTLSKWRQILLGLGFFAVLSYMPVSQIFPLGFFGPNIRSGHLEAGSLLSHWSDRLKMAGLEANQLFFRADDPWFSTTTTGGGLDAFQTTLLIPGIILAVMALRHERDRDYGMLILIGLSIAAVPAIFASDSSFRRLIPVATLAALAAAFTLVRLVEIATIAGVSRKIILTIVCTGAVALSAVGTFGYFDRSVAGEEVGNGWLKSLGTAVTSRMGKESLVVVVPNQSDVENVNRYITLMAYYKLLDAQTHGVPREKLFSVTSCDENISMNTNSTVDHSPALFILPDFFSTLPQPCGVDYMNRLMAQHPGSSELIVTPPSLPADLAPAQP
jgi:4-amino-4-deoxy-L-arabinose transferase-like glycosyltransferase